MAPVHIGERFLDIGLLLVEEAPDERAEPALGETFGERIDGSDAVEVNGVFLARFKHLGFGMIQSSRFEAAEFSIGKDLVTLTKIMLHERQVPPAAMESGGAVVQDEFEQGAAAAAKAIKAQGQDAAPDGGGNARFEVGDPANLAAVLIAAGAMPKKVLHGESFESG